MFCLDLILPLIDSLYFVLL